MSFRSLGLSGLLAEPLHHPITQWQTAHGQWAPFSIVSFTEAQSWTGSAVYIMATEAKAGRHTAIYVGEAEDIGPRIRSHERLAEAISRGATSLHVHLLAETYSERVALERGLIQGQNPPLNKQHKNRNQGLFNIFE